MVDKLVPFRVLIIAISLEANGMREDEQEEDVAILPLCFECAKMVFFQIRRTYQLIALSFTNVLFAYASEYLETKAERTAQRTVTSPLIRAIQSSR